MSQFTNPYNGQNGMNMYNPGVGMDPGGMNGPPPNNMGNMGPQQSPGYSNQNYNYSNQGQSMPNVQGWKNYAPDPPSPPVKPLVGYWVDSFNDIKPKDVAMDGQMHFFPQADHSCIYAKFWNNNGQLLSFRFLPEKDEPIQQQQTIPSEVTDMVKGYEIVTERMSERVANLEGLLADIYNAVVQPAPTTRGRKQAANSGTGKEEQ